MIFQQITRDDLGCASYLIGDEQAVVDPRFEIDGRESDPCGRGRRPPTGRFDYPLERTDNARTAV